MRVNVFISKVTNDGPKPSLLVLPTTADAFIPSHLQDREWSYFATSSSGDQLIGGSDVVIETSIVSQGYAHVPVPRR